MKVKILNSLFRASCLLIASLSFSSNAVSTETATFIHYQLTNPLVQPDTVATGVRVFNSGQVLVVRPAGFKEPGSHRFVLSSAAMTQLAGELSFLGEGALSADTLVNPLPEPALQDINAATGQLIESHRSDPTIATVAVFQFPQNADTQVLTQIQDTQIPTNIFTVDPEKLDALEAQALSTAQRKLLSLTRKMQYLYKLPMYQSDADVEVNFER